MATVLRNPEPTGSSKEAWATGPGRRPSAVNTSGNRYGRVEIRGSHAGGYAVPIVRAMR